MITKEFKVKEITKTTREVLKNEEKDISPTLKLCIDSLINVTEALADAVDKLEAKVNKNSRNSSKPPSSDQNRPYQKRINKGTKSGGKKGHKGSTLKKVSNPDKTQKHKLDGSCNDCGASLSEVEILKLIKRQVVDVIFDSQVTEHQAEVGICFCGKKHTAQFPKGINNHIQYGHSVRALVNYFSQYQLIPYERCEEIFKDIFNLGLCEGTIFNINKEATSKLNYFEIKLKEALLNSKVNHVDETPININGKQSYLHVLSNDYFTFLSANKSRGKIAVEEMEVLKKFKGILVHDFFSMYFNYGKHHAMCNAHIIRELTYAEEEEGKRWAHEMRIFIEDLYEFVYDLRNEGKVLDSFLKKEFEDAYDSILLRGFKECPDYNDKKRTKSTNLYRRMLHYKDDIIRFMWDPDVPFTNNQAERDLRMAKIRQKISGGFRSFEGAQIFAKLRSYISTIKKQSKSVYEGLMSIFSEDKTFVNQLVKPSF